MEVRFFFELKFKMITTNIRTTPIISVVSPGLISVREATKSKALSGMVMRQKRKPMAEEPSATTPVIAVTVANKT